MIVEFKSEEQFQNGLPDLLAGKTLVRHGSQPVGQDRQDVGLDEGHLQIGLVQLSHDHTQHGNLLGGWHLGLVEFSIFSGRQSHVCDHLGNGVVVVIDEVNVLTSASASVFGLLLLKHDIKVAQITGLTGTRICHAFVIGRVCGNGFGILTLTFLFFRLLTFFSFFDSGLFVSVVFVFVVAVAECGSDSFSGRAGLDSGSRVGAAADGVGSGTVSTSH